MHILERMPSNLKEKIIELRKTRGDQHAQVYLVLQCGYTPNQARNIIYGLDNPKGEIDVKEQAKQIAWKWFNLGYTVAVDGKQADAVQFEYLWNKKLLNVDL